MTALDRDTKDTLRLCYDFLKVYEDIFIDTDYYRMKRDYVMVRKEVVGVLKRHVKKTTRKQKEIPTT